MALKDVKDFVIRYPGHPKYDPNRIIEDDDVEVIVQKLEMLLFTTKGEFQLEDDVAYECGDIMEFDSKLQALQQIGLRDISFSADQPRPPSCGVVITYAMFFTPYGYD